MQYVVQGEENEKQGQKRHIEQSKNLLSTDQNLTKNTHILEYKECWINETFFEQFLLNIYIKRDGSKYSE